MWNKVSLPDSMLPKLYLPVSHSTCKQLTAWHITHEVTSGPDPNTKLPFPLSSLSYSLWDIFMERWQEVDLSPVLEIKQVNTARPPQDLALITKVTRVWIGCQPGWLSIYPPRSVLRCSGAGPAVPEFVILWCGWVAGSWKDQLKTQWVRCVHTASWSQDSTEDSPFLNLRNKGQLKGSVAGAVSLTVRCSVSPPSLSSDPL